MKMGRFTKLKQLDRFLPCSDQEPETFKSKLKNKSSRPEGGYFIKTHIRIITCLEFMEKSFFFGEKC